MSVREPDAKQSGSATDPSRLSELVQRQLERVQSGPLSPAAPLASDQTAPASDPPAAPPPSEESAPPSREPQPAIAASMSPRSTRPIGRISLAKRARIESVRGRVARATAERDQRTLPIDLPDRKKRARAEEETREELLNRLLDPELTLAETAKVLDVCPATVRRYADKGALIHHRTPGNQRRFKLADVLEFLARRDRSVVEDIRDMDL